MAANQEPERLAAAACLLIAARSATLATVSEGAPHTSLVTPALAADGQPVLLLSALAIHTRHLRATPACSLLLLGAPQSDNPQTTPRLSLSGHAHLVAAEEVRARFLEIHPYAIQYAGFTDFSFWKITVSTAQYIGGFANAAYLDVTALQQEISAHLSRANG